MSVWLALVVLTVGIDPKPFSDTIGPAFARLVMEVGHSKVTVEIAPCWCSLQIADFLGAGHMHVILGRCRLN
jgi:hypothetical protein